MNAEEWDYHFKKIKDKHFSGENVILIINYLIDENNEFNQDELGCLHIAVTDCYAFNKVLGSVISSTDSSSYSIEQMMELDTAAAKYILSLDYG